MNNTIETQGLRVLNISPSQRASNVNVNSHIDITFSSDINLASLEKNVVVLEDFNKVYKDVSSLKDYSKFGVVRGSVSYKDKTLTFVPEKAFQTGMCYVVMLNDGITDITGNKMVKKHVSCFYTETVASFPVCKFTAPKYGFITDSVPEFVWENVAAPSYVFQVSKVNSFELLLCNEVIPGNEVEDVIKYLPKREVFLKEGMYFIRVKAENGDWSNVHQIFIKPITDAVVAEQDTPEAVNLEDFLDGLEEPLEILEYFPVPNSINNNLKTNIIYIKIKGKFDESKLRLEDSYVYGETVDEEHEEYSHQEVSGSWSIVYDSYFDVTYIIFTPDSEQDIQEREAEAESQSQE